jgi:hypothetical protein
MRRGDFDPHGRTRATSTAYRDDLQRDLRAAIERLETGQPAAKALVALIGNFRTLQSALRFSARGRQ